MKPSSDSTSGHFQLPDRSTLGPRGHLLASVAVAVFLGIASSVGATILLFTAIPIFTDSTGQLSVGEFFQVLQIALAVIAGTGGIVALVVAYRKQRVSEAAHEVILQATESVRFKEYNERFVSAVEQLGNDTSAAVRIGGIYSLVKLADDSPDNRQRCVDVLCGYLRFPVSDARGAAEFEVRKTISVEMAAHLKPDAKVSWDGLYFNFRGAQLDGLDFSAIEIRSSELDFSDCSLSDGMFSVRDAKISVDDERTGINLSGLKLTGGEVDARGCFIKSGALSFARSELAAGVLAICGSHPWGGRIVLDGTRLTGAKVDLTDITVAATSTDYANFAPLQLNKLEVTDGSIDFGNLKPVTLDGLKYDSPHPPTKRAGGYKVLEMEYVSMKGGLISFRETEIPFGLLALAGWTVTGGELDFEFARLRLKCALDMQGLKMSGGTINFKYARIGSADHDKLYSGPSEWVKRLERIDQPYLRDMVFAPAPWGQLDLSSARIDGGSITFYDSKIRGAVVELYGMRMSAGSITFEAAMFEGSVVNIYNSELPADGGINLQPEQYYEPTVLYTTVYGFEPGRVKNGGSAKFVEVSAAD